MSDHVAGQQGRMGPSQMAAGGPCSSPTQEAIDAAYEVLLAYRAAHQTPLAKATMGLRSMVNSEGCGSRSLNDSSGLRRSSTSSRREPTMQLGNMQDIGGSRAVLDTIDEWRRVERRPAYAGETALAAGTDYEYVLFMNARDSMPAGGLIEVRTGARTVTSKSK